MIAKRKGVIVRWGLKEAWSKRTSRCTGTGLEAYGAGRVGKWQRSPYPSRALVVNSAVACGRRSNLPREICRFVVESQLGIEQSILTGRQKSAEGVVGAEARKA